MVDEKSVTVTCPNCGRAYVPLLDRPEEERLDLKIKYGLSYLILKEQKITGICSDSCWDEFLGVKKKKEDL